MFSPRLLRSTMEACKDIDHFSKKVKKGFNTNCQLSVFSSLDQEPIKPGPTIHELLKMDGLRKKSDESSLFVKLIPVTQDSIASKSIYIRDVDDDCIKFSDIRTISRDGKRRQQKQWKHRHYYP
jgi:hypothetical protein